MKRIIISLDHVMGAIVAAYEREMKIRSNGCSTEDGRLILNFSVDMMKRSQLDKLEAAKWLKMCGFEMKYEGSLIHVILSLTVPYEKMMLSGVICRKLTEKELNNLFWAVAKTSMKALPVVALEGGRFGEHAVVGRAEVRYVSGMTPEGVSVSRELDWVASLFNGYADGFEEDQFGGKARIELTLDWENVESTD